ncbi:hypothetical protein [Sorangium sp. So ce1153]|uniref:hypothetical protein n=1 Tax=Sorangium sp. So ce1153 TaxID=3133333 RepID=UPI003F648906
MLAEGAVAVRLREENLRRFRARMREVRLLYELGAIDAGEVASRVRAWLAPARHGHTRALCRRVLDELAFGGGEGPEAGKGEEGGEGG